jgi:protein-L-isoaspartate O-methyltransferase
VPEPAVRSRDAIVRQVFTLRHKVLYIGTCTMGYRIAKLAYILRTITSFSSTGKTGLLERGLSWQHT